MKLKKARLNTRILGSESRRILTVLMRVSCHMITFTAMKTAVVLGASGLVGKALVSALEADADYTAVHLLVRRVSGQKASKTTEHVIEFDNPGSYPSEVVPDVVFCCLGTTIKKAGSQEAFERVDFGYVLEAAKHYRALGTAHFAVVSAVGADASSKIFYSRVKGRMEEALRQLNYPALTVVRPSMLGGDRQEFRFGEWLGTVVLKLIQWSFVGRLRRYRIVHDHQVAEAMIQSVYQNQTGEALLESEMLPPLAAAYRKRMA